MTYATKTDGAWALVYPGIPFVDATGISRPGNWLELASDAERDDAEVYAVQEPDPAPEGKVAVRGPLPVGEDRPVWPVTYEDAPAPPAPPPFTVFKADIWRRCTDTEADKLDAAIRAQPVRLRRLFDDAVNLQSDDALFGQIEGAVAQLLGQDRAAAILAPSEG